MHFSKTYTQLLLTLPEELRNSAIEYRRLKKLINELVAELDSLGLSPEVLQNLLQNDEAAVSPSENKGKQRALGERPEFFTVALPALAQVPIPSSAAKVAYELSEAGEEGKVIPHLRLWIEQTAVYEEMRGSDITEEAEISGTVDSQPDEVDPARPSETIGHRRPSLESKVPSDDSIDEKFRRSEDIITLSSPIIRTQLWNMQERPVSKHPSSWIINDELDGISDDTPVAPCTEKDEKTNREVVIPLVSDTEFYRLLMNALNSLASALANMRNDMTKSIHDLCEVVSQTARPASAGGKSDLYTWRAVFQLYMEAEVFESTQERNRGERTIEDSESRLAQFAQRVNNGGFAFKLKESGQGLQRFLEFNVRLMNIKKKANAEAARKIMKKHVKRTALPVPNTATDIIPSLNFDRSHSSIPHILVVTLTERLLPIIPHIDDYVCLICTSLAFRPIRLNCGHLFCVRCLVKMQKRGQDNCPMCRAPTVLSANKSNLDLAVINLMRDWFPKEMKEKALANEKEVAREQLGDIGLDDRCLIM